MRVADKEIEFAVCAKEYQENCSMLFPVKLFNAFHGTVDETKMLNSLSCTRCFAFERFA